MTLHLDILHRDKPVRASLTCLRADTPPETFAILAEAVRNKSLR